MIFIAGIICTYPVGFGHVLLIVSGTVDMRYLVRCDEARLVFAKSATIEGRGVLGESAKIRHVCGQPITARTASESIPRAARIASDYQHPERVGVAHVATAWSRCASSADPS